MADKYDLLLLLERPYEPVFMERGRKTIFDVPEKFLTERYRMVGNELLERFGQEAGRRISVTDITLPDLHIPMQLPRKAQFTLCIPAHRFMARRLIDIFMAMNTIDELQSVAAYAHDRVNPYLFNYALSVAVLHREDTKGVGLLSFVQSFPNKFIDRQVFRHLREECTIVPEGSRMPIVIPRDYTASELEPEHRLWYFREDFGVNLYHWQRYLVYPLEATERRVVFKERRGELFYYMYEQILARYNVERFCNKLPRVEPLNNLREFIKEGYFPKMEWPPRFDNTKLSDVKRYQDQLILDIGCLQRWMDLIYKAISEGSVIDESVNRIPLDIEVLGNIIESSEASPHRNLYGELHNMGNLFIAYAHDPEHRHLETFGVIGDLSTAMRDPAFYRWHANLQNIFQAYKTRLPPYTTKELHYEGVSLTGVEVAVEDSKTPNVLKTHWQVSDIDLSPGLDFAPRGNIFARFTHLQHTPFTYTINVNNESETQRFGLVRIFLGPKADERGQDIDLKEQRLLMIELDKFAVSLQPGENVIRRRSNESSLTLPIEQTFRERDTKPDSTQKSEYNVCACGWPHHMLIPKGLPDGLRCELFVIISNYDKDVVGKNSKGDCNDSAAHCNLREQLFPDNRALGFPFDRLTRLGVEHLRDFLTPNMSLIEVIVQHEDRTDHCC